MTTRRRSLRDRNQQAMAADPEPQADETATPDPAPTPAPEPQAEQATEEPKKTRATASKATASDTTRLGIYLTPVEFNNAKAAYLADWNNGGQSDTFARWIGAAIDTHAARSPQQRGTAEARVRAAKRAGASKSFSIPTGTVTQMRAAITADQQAGRWPSDSAWCGEAIRSAVDHARTHNGGTLPTPPARLPNRLIR